jgi:hypothetical protein
MVVGDVCMYITSGILFEHVLGCGRSMLEVLSMSSMQAAGLELKPGLKRGSVFLVPAGTALMLQSDAAAGPMLVSRTATVRCHMCCRP